MGCIECKAPNPEDNRFCGKCGAELGHTLDETVRRKGFRDRQATEMEITESVVDRLLKWTKWLGSVLALILLAFGFFIGNTWLNIRASVSRGQTQIQDAVRDGKKQIESASSDILALQQTAANLKGEYDRLQSDAAKYGQLTETVEKLQKEFKDANGRWKDVDLTVHSLNLGGKGPLLLGIPKEGLGCITGIGAKNEIVFCAKGSPPTLYQITRDSELRPVASVSPIGFRDASTEPKPKCAASSRGTVYVEKGAERVADQPLVCVKRSNETYGWFPLGTVP